MIKIDVESNKISWSRMSSLPPKYYVQLPCIIIIIVVRIEWNGIVATLQFYLCRIYVFILAFPHLRAQQ